MALDQEIAASRRKGGDRVWVSNGSLIGQSQEGWLYEFRLESEAHVPDDCGIEVEVKGTRTAGTVVAIEGFDIVLDLEEQLSGDLRSCVVIIKLWYILERLRDRLADLAESELPQGAADLLATLESDGAKAAPLEPGSPWPELNARQSEAVASSFALPVTFIWGPPGTGKTTTVGRLVERHVVAGEKVLVLAYSNAALDVAMVSVAKLFPGAASDRAGEVLRIGTPRNEAVRNHPWLSTLAALRSVRPQLVAEYERLRARLSELRAAGSSSRLDAVREELRSVREELKAEERRLALNAKALGSTLAKAAVDDLCTEYSADLVVVDEASMASTPFGCLAARLATSRVVVAGDFMQLPPVVLSDEANAQRWIGRHVFDFAGVPDSVRTERTDTRLTQLTEQYRMHPTIRETVSRVFYRGTLHDGEGIEERTKPIASRWPSQGRAVLVVDTERLIPRCPSEPRNLGQSRFNLPHFIGALALISRAVSEHDSIAYITPFRAQAKLARRAIDDLQLGPKVQASTVHKFQGSEADLVVVDLASAPPHSPLGPLLSGDEWALAGKLLNVAISRARGKLIVLSAMRHLNGTMTPRDAIYKVLASLASSGVGGEIQIDTLRKLLGAGPTKDAVALDEGPVFRLGHVNEDGLEARSEIILNVPAGSPLPAWLREASRRGVRTIITGDGLSSEWLKLPGSRVVPTNRSNAAVLVDRGVLWLDIAARACRIALPGTASYVADLIRLIPDEERGAVLPGTQAFDKKGPLGVTCRTCGNPMWLDENKYGPYLRCTDSQCRKTRALTAEIATQLLRTMGKVCPECGSLPVASGLPSAGIEVRCSSHGCSWNQRLDDLL
jgi:hypothetical protein